MTTPRPAIKPDVFTDHLTEGDRMQAGSNPDVSERNLEAANDAAKITIEPPKKEPTGRERSLANLRMGGGRPKKSLLSRRETILRDIDRYIHKGKRVSWWKQTKLAELIEQADGPTLRWIIDQEIGSPRTTIEQVVDNQTIIMQLAPILASKAGQTVTEELAQDVVTQLQAKLKER